MRYKILSIECKQKKNCNKERFAPTTTLVATPAWEVAGYVTPFMSLFLWVEVHLMDSSISRRHSLLITSFSCNYIIYYCTCC